MIPVFYSISLQTSEPRIPMLNVVSHQWTDEQKNRDEWCSRKNHANYAFIEMLLLHNTHQNYQRRAQKQRLNTRKTLMRKKKPNLNRTEEKKSITKNNIHYVECLCRILRADRLECTVCNVCIECVQKKERFKVLIANRFSTSRVWKSIYFRNTLLFMLIFSMEKPADCIGNAQWDESKKGARRIRNKMKKRRAQHTHGQSVFRYTGS